MRPLGPIDSPGPLVDHGDPPPIDPNQNRAVSHQGDGWDKHAGPPDKDVAHAILEPDREPHRAEPTNENRAHHEGVDKKPG